MNPSAPKTTKEIYLKLKKKSKGAIIDHEMLSGGVVSINITIGWISDKVLRRNMTVM